MEMPVTQTAYYPLVGGLDAESAILSRSPGLVAAALNYESSQQTGYERIGGIERFDGRARPSDATVRVLESATDFTGVVVVGNTINGQTSGAVAKVIQIRTPKQLVLTRQIGEFTIGENLRVGAVVIGTYTAAAQDVTRANESALLALAANDYRTDIATVPGSGPIRGIAMLGATVYAWRNNAGGTAMAIYKSTASGWAAVTLFKEVAFTAGNGAPPAEGATITKGATGTVKRVVTTSGSWTGGTAAGRFIVDNVTGGSFSAGAFSAGATATCSGAETQITLAPNGRVETVIYNFTGSTATERIYGCDGVNPGFEFDGTVYVPIRTGMTTDTPRHVAAHRNHLFFSFNASVQNSGIANPYAWTPVFGAAEISVGQDVTGFVNLPGEVDSAPLMIFSLGRTTVIYGTSSADWKMVTYSTNYGSQRYGVQNMGIPVAMGVNTINPIVQSSSYGNFENAPASDRIQSYLTNKTVAASLVNRKLGRMRLFFTDGTGLSITSVGGSLAFMPINYGFAANVAVSGNVNSEPRCFVGGTDGYVYETDAGRSFDGADIPAWLKLTLYHAKSPGVRKRFRKIGIEAKTRSDTVVRFAPEFLSADGVSMGDVATRTMNGGASIWDTSAWDSAYFDSVESNTSNFRLDGCGTGVSLVLDATSGTQLPHVLQSITTSYTLRRQER